MANYFNWIYKSVHADSKVDECGLFGNVPVPDSSGIGVGASGGAGMGSSGGVGVEASGIILAASTIAATLEPSVSISGDNPWYILPPPPIYPIVPSYTPSEFHSCETFEYLFHDMASNLHFPIKMEESGNEGIYGLFYFLQMPEFEIAASVDIPALIAGGLCCTLLGMYLDDISYPRKFLSWWPTRWFFHFVEEGIYLRRTIRWIINAEVILIKMFFRAAFGASTHLTCRLIYFWVRQALLGGKVVPYVPLFDETFAALLSSYTWTSYTVETFRHNGYDRIIATGWSAVFTGLVDHCLSLYFMKDPPSGLFRWTFGGAFYGPGFWRYLKMGTGSNPEDW